jgi:hypothetical protein
MLWSLLSVKVLTHHSAAANVKMNSDSSSFEPPTNYFTQTNDVALRPIDGQIKTGVHNTYLHFHHEGWTPVQIARSISNALDILSRLDDEAEEVPSDDGNAEKPTGWSYFSGKFQTRVRFWWKVSMGCFVARKNKLKPDTPPVTSAEMRDTACEKWVWDIVRSHSTDECEEATFSGIVCLLSSVTAIEGSFQSTFLSFQHVFGLLSRAYSSITEQEALAEDGAYSKWMDLTWLVSLLSTLMEPVLTGISYVTGLRRQTTRRAG